MLSDLITHISALFIVFPFAAFLNLPTKHHNWTLEWSGLVNGRKRFTRVSATQTKTRSFSEWWRSEVAMRANDQTIFAFMSLKLLLRLSRCANVVQFYGIVVFGVFT